MFANGIFVVLSIYAPEVCSDLFHCGYEIMLCFLGSVELVLTDLNSSWINCFAVPDNT